VRFPLLLNTGRVRDHWHAMTRTGKAVTLARHVQEPMLARHPDDADSLDLAEGHHARIESLHGSACLRVTIDDGLTPGMVFAPFHWTNATSGMARIEAAVHPLTDKVSGQPELKATSVSVTRVIMASEGFLLSRTRVELPAWLQHTRITIPVAKRCCSPRRAKRSHCTHVWSIISAKCPSAPAFLTLRFRTNAPSASMASGFRLRCLSARRASLLCWSG
jgi:predicted molibdopterin-dependent oxidoreductase YjgC